MVDVVVVGAGHNGLVAATVLARAGLSVRVLERAPVVAGACRLHGGVSAGPDATGADADAGAGPAAGPPGPALLPADPGRSQPAARRGPGLRPRPVRPVLHRGRRPGRRGARRRARGAAGGPRAGLAGGAAAAGGDRGPLRPTRAAGRV